MQSRPGTGRLSHWGRKAARLKLDRSYPRRLHNFDMRRHQLTWRLRRLTAPQLALIAATVFLATVAGGLYGPALLASARTTVVAALAAIPAPAANARLPTVDRYFRNCAAAHAAGVYSIPRGAPGYRAALDADDDGLACEPYYGG